MKAMVYTKYGPPEAGRKNIGIKLGPRFSTPRNASDVWSIESNESGNAETAGQD